jgi:hypothetical protein
MQIKPQNYAALEYGLELLEMFDRNLVLADVVASQDEIIQTANGFPDVSPFKDSGKGKHVQCGDLHFERGVFVKKAKKMIRERLSRATNRVELFTKYGYDVKFGGNLIQLLKEGIEIMETGAICMPLEYRQDILDIKNGKYTAEEIMEWADDLVEDAREAYEKSELPTHPRSEEIEKLAISEVKRFLSE